MKYGWILIKSFDLFSINQLIPSSKLMLYALAQLKFGVHISVRRPPFSIPDFHFFFKFQKSTTIQKMAKEHSILINELTSQLEQGHTTVVINTSTKESIKMTSVGSL